MTESDYLKICLQLVEERVSLGISKYWSEKDFENLSGEISVKSKILISIHTVKRLFGRMKTSKNYNPQLETKNALAIYLGYANWQDFKETYFQAKNTPQSVPVGGSETLLPDGQASPATHAATDVTQPFLFLNLKKWRMGILTGIVGVVAIGWVYSLTQSGLKATTHAYPRIALQADILKSVIPFTTIFTFDLSAVKADSIFLHVGDGTKVLLQPRQTTYSYAYAIPNYYRAKITADTTEIARTSVHALSNGWNGLVFLKTNDLYLIKDPKEFRRQGVLQLSREVAKKYVTSAAPLEYWTHFRNVRDYQAEADNMVFETRFKNLDNNQGIWFNDVAVKLIGEQHAFLRLHFVNRGGQGKVAIQCSDTSLDGKEKNLAAFAQDLSAFRTMRVQVKNREALVYFEDKLIYKIPYTKTMGKLKCIILNSRGSGEFDYVKLYDGEKELVYEDDFNG